MDAQILVKNTNKKGSTTITIKVSSDTRRAWDKFCVNNDINQSATMTAIIEKLIKDGSDGI